MNYKNWWSSLSNEWKTAFNEVVFRKGEVLTQPIDAEIELLLMTKTLRFAGPTAAYPNMKTLLKDLSGLTKFQNLETLVIINHDIKTINELAYLINLKEFYFQSNKIKSLKLLENLINLEKIYASNNLIENFDGITEAHSYKLKNFHILPNINLTDREIIKFENSCYIKCLKG
jgi:hypothetical protein